MIRSMWYARLMLGVPATYPGLLAHRNICMVPISHHPLFS
jgi:hypothetical protein